MLCILSPGVYTPAMSQYLKLTLAGNFRETAPLVQSLATRSLGKAFQFDYFQSCVERAITNRHIRVVLVDCRSDFRTALFGGLEAVRSQLLRLRNAGKEIEFCAQSYGTRELFLASAATRRFIHPLGTLRFFGIALSFFYLGGLLRKYHVQLQFVRRGRYKTAVDRFAANGAKPEDREQYGAYLETVRSTITEVVQEELDVSPAEIRSMLEGKVYFADDAVERRWIDRACPAAERELELKEEKFRPVRLPVRTGYSFGFGPLRKSEIAVLELEGGISDGESAFNPVSGQLVGSRSFGHTVEMLRKARSVKGVVLRVNSSGGTATASDDMLVELNRLAAVKPLVVSMSEVAGSGGYWVTLGAERIFAHRTTLTGSIGVFALLPNIRKLLSEYGIEPGTEKSSDLADFTSVFRSRNRRELEIIDAEIDRMYRIFVGKVASARSRTNEEIDEVGQGRVWSGGNALDHGLVDSEGDLATAIEYLRQKLRLSRGRIRFYPRAKKSLAQRLFSSALGTLPALPGTGVLQEISPPWLYPPYPAGSALPNLTALLSASGDRPLAFMPTPELRPRLFGPLFDAELAGFVVHEDR